MWSYLTLNLRTSVLWSVWHSLFTCRHNCFFFCAFTVYCLLFVSQRFGSMCFPSIVCELLDDRNHVHLMCLAIGSSFSMKSEKSESHSLMSNSLWPCGLYSPWNSPGQNTGVGNSSLLQWNLPNPGLLHCRRILYQLSHKGSPFGIPLFSIPLLNECMNGFTEVEGELDWEG